MNRVVRGVILMGLAASHRAYNQDEVVFISKTKTRNLINPLKLNAIFFDMSALLF